MSVAKKDYKRITTKTLVEMKENGEKISMLTSYDFTMAKIVDSAGVDVILVGDSASNVMAGHETTLPITLDQMIYHASAVVRAIERALVVVDLPFGSYQSDPKEALRSAIRIMKESGAHTVKLEGGKEVKESIRIVDARFEKLQDDLLQKDKIINILRSYLSYNLSERAKSRSTSSGDRQ